MSSMAPVNHGPQLLTSSSNPSGLTKKVELAEGKNVHKSIYIYPHMSPVQRCKIMQKGNDSGGRILKNTEKQGDAKKKKRSYKQCQVAWFAGNLSGRLNKCDKRRAKATVAERGGDTRREMRDKEREERMQVDQLWHDYFSILGRWRK